MKSTFRLTFIDVPLAVLDNMPWQRIFDITLTLLKPFCLYH